MAEPMLACHDLDEMFGSVVTYGRAPQPKPHPAPLLLCCEELGVEAGEDVWYVGDSASDCRAAGAAGMSFAWAAWGHDDSPPAGAEVILEHFDELLAL